MSNVTFTAPITQLTMSGGVISGVHYTDANGVDQVLPIGADALADITPQVGFILELLDDGNYRISTPELTPAAAPVTYTWAGVVSAIAALPAAPTAIVTQSGVQIPLPVTPTTVLPVGVTFGDLTAPVTLLTPASGGDTTSAPANDTTAGVTAGLTA